MSNKQCPNCEQEITVGTKSCPSCGLELCSRCASGITKGAKFCSSCGLQVFAASPDLGRPEMAGREDRREDRGVRWVRRGQEIATRIAPSDLKGLLTSGLEVQPGTRALFFIGGRYVATLSPGRHTLETLRQKLTTLSLSEGEPTAIVVDDGELGLELEVPDLHAADHHAVILYAQASLRLAEPELFIANLFRDAASFTLDQLEDFLAREVNRTLRELVMRQKAEDLHTGRASGEIEMELLSRWRATLERTGFVLNRFRVLDFKLPGLEEAERLRKQQAEDAAVFDPKLAGLRLDTEFTRRRGEAAVERAVVEQDVAENVAEVELDGIRREAERLGRRNPVWERLLQERNLQEMSTLTSDAEWNKFFRRVGSENILGANEHAAIKNAAPVSVEYLTRTIILNAEKDHEELRAKREYQLEITRLLGQRDLDKTRLEAEIAERKTAHEEMLRARNAEFGQKLSEAERELGFEERKARNEADLQHLRLERLEALRQMAKDRDAARELEAKIKEAELEIKRIQTESDVLVGMNADQILAVAVARDPGKAGEIEKAIRAMKSGEATAIQKEMYERMLLEVKEVTERSQLLDHDKFRLSVDADARHRARYETLDEQEKNRGERVATAGLTADDKKSMKWLYCEIHGMKYMAMMGCPLCQRDKASG